MYICWFYAEASLWCPQINKCIYKTNDINCKPNLLKCGYGDWIGLPPDDISLIDIPNKTPDRNDDKNEPSEATPIAQPRIEWKSSPYGSYSLEDSTMRQSGFIETKDLQQNRRTLHSARHTQLPHLNTKESATRLICTDPSPQITST